MQRLFWPVTDLGELNPTPDLGGRLRRWADDWLPATDNVSYEICPGTVAIDDALLTLTSGGQFRAAICFSREFSDELIAALPEAAPREPDDQHRLLTRVGEEMLLDLRRDVFAGANLPPLECNAACVELPDQLASIVFSADNDCVRLWCAADFLINEPAVDAPDISPAFRARCVAEQTAEVSVTTHVPATMESLLALSPGDVLPLAPLDDSPLVLRVSGEPVCRAYLGRSGEHKALLLVDKPVGN